MFSSELFSGIVFGFAYETVTFFHVCDTLRMGKCELFCLFWCYFFQISDKHNDVAMKFSVFSKDEHVCSVQKQSYFAVCIVVALAVFSLELFSGIVFCFAHETV